MAYQEMKPTRFQEKELASTLINQLVAENAFQNIPFLHTKYLDNFSDEELQELNA